MEEEKEEGENWYAKLKARSKLAMIEKREKQTSEEREVENCDARSGMKNFREKKSAEEKEYDKISEKYRKRESRAKRTELITLFKNIRQNMG